jgi:uncharacterized membrane protein YraQ (UPF0718 family)
MKNKKNSKGIDVALLILCTLLIAAFAITLYKGGWGLTFYSLTNAGRLFKMVWFRLLLGFLLGGFIQVLIPREVVSKWLGASSGLKGILIGSYLGVFSSGGPYMWLPVVATIHRAGADIGPVLSLMTARGLIGIQALFVWHIPFLGVELSLARFITCLLVPPIVGLLGRTLFRILDWSTLSPDAVEEFAKKSSAEGT